MKTPKYILYLILLILFPSEFFSDELDSLNKLLPKLSKTKQKADVLFEIAIYQTMFNVDSAYSYANTCLSLSEKLNYISGKAKAYYIFGVIARNSNNLDSAMFYFNKTKDLTLYSNDKKTYARSLLGIGRVFNLKQDYKKALNILLPAKDIFIKLNDARLVNAIYNEIGGVLTGLNDFDAEVRLRNELYIWNLNQKDTLNLAFTAHGIAMLYSYKGYHKEAIPWETKAIRHFRAIKNKEFVANAYLSLGYSYYNLGKFEIAIAKFLKAFSIHEKLNSKESMAIDIGNIAMIYYDMKEYDEALKYYEKSLKLYTETGNKIWKASTLANIGQINFNKGNFEKALMHYRQALAIGIEIRHISGIACYHQYIGTIFQQKKLFDSAEFYFEESLRLYKSVIENDGITSALNALADLHFTKGDYDQTNLYGEEALKLSINTNTKLRMQQLYELLSKSYSKQGNFNKAYNYKSIASELKDSILDYDKTRQIGRIEANFEIKRQLEEEKRIKSEKVRVMQEAKVYRDNIEYFGIILFVIISIFIVFNFRKTNIKASTLDKFVFIIFLLIFEFVSILLDSPINSISKGDALLNLLSAVVFAFLITPVHDKLKDKIINKLNTDKNRYE